MTVMASGRPGSGIQPPRTGGGVDFPYYAGDYHGTLIPEDRFEETAALARRYLIRATRVDALGAGEAGGLWRSAACAVAEEYFRQSMGGEIVSESVGGHSVSYASGGQTAAERLFAAAERYLGGTGLLYRGV